jgi:hypothetical protein
MTKPAIALQRNEPDADTIRQTWMCEALGKDSFIELSRKPSAEQVKVLGTRLDVIERGERETFFEKGVIVIYVERTRLWAEWPNPKDEGKPFHSFDAWMGSGEGGETCRTSRYDARTFVQETKELPPETVKKIARKNTKKFIDIPKKRRSEPKVLEAACTLSKPRFDAFVEENIPEAHSEGTRRLTFNLERSQYRTIHPILVEAQDRYEATSLEEALEYGLIELRQGWRKEERDREEAKGKGASA